MRKFLMLLFLGLYIPNGFTQSVESDEWPIEWTILTSLINANKMIGEARKTTDYLYVGLCKKYLEFAQLQLDYLKSRKEIETNLANHFQVVINELARINSKATNIDLAMSKAHRDIHYKIFGLAKYYFSLKSN